MTPTMGQFVHYISPQNRESVALVTTVQDDGTVCLCMFMSRSDTSFDETGPGCTAVIDVPYDADSTPLPGTGSFHAIPA